MYIAKIRILFHKKLLSRYQILRNRNYVISVVHLVTNTASESNKFRGKMKAVLFTSGTNRVELTNLPIPTITDQNDVLIKVCYSGICGTDLHIVEGKFPVTQDHPLILGHEFSGIVTDFGEKVKNFEKGDRVAADPNDSCLSCDWCHSGKPHFCTGKNRNLGTFRNGGWSEFVLVPAHMVHKLPEGVSLEQGALAEPLSCLSHGLGIIEPIPVGSCILITGAGIIGVLWACICHLRGHKNVTVCEPNLARLDILKQLDLGYELVTPTQLKECPAKERFDVIIDCSGYAPIIEFSVDLLKKGGKLLCFGVASPEAEIKVKPFELYLKELVIMGAKINPFSFIKALSLIEAMNERYIQLEKLGIKMYKLEDYKSALNDIKQGVVLKALFQL